MSGDAVTDALLIGARLLWYGGCLGVIGASAIRLFVSSAAPEPAAELDRHAATTGLASAVVLASGALARLYAQAYVSFGLEEPVTASLLLLVATDLPPWSTGWMLQFAAGGIGVMSFPVARTGSRAGWMMAHGAAVAVAVSMPLTGHAVSQAGWYTVPIALQATHVLGAGIWIGGLFVLIVVGVSRAVREPRLLTPGALALVVSAFSPLALVGAGLLGLTGGVTALLYLSALDDLWTSSYGRALVLKVALVGGVAAAGFVNWRRVKPRLTNPGGPGLLRQSATLELALAALVLAVTALLVGLPQPGD